MPGAVLRMLQNSLRAEGLNHGSNLFGLVPHDDKRLFCAQRRARANDVLDERASSGAVQNFCKA